MKKHFVLGILFLFIIVSCEKGETGGREPLENSTSIEEFPFVVDVQANRLEFPTREDYDKALGYLGKLSSEELEEWSTGLGFTSLKTALSEAKREEMGIYDDLLATLINPQFQLTIGDYILTLDALAEEVHVASTSNKEKKALNGKSSRTFSTEDDVLDILDGTATAVTAERSRYCKKRKISWNLNFSTTPSKVHAKVVYQKAGFLNSLQSKIEEELGLDGTSKWRMFLKTHGQGNFWRNKKRSGTIGPYEASIFNRANKSFRPYYSSRRLRAYKFSIEFWARSDNDGALRKKVITIDCD